MATLSKLSILIDANAAGVSKGLAPIVPQLKQFQSAATSALNSAAMRTGAVIASFLTVEKLLGRVKRAFSDLERVRPLISESTLKGALAMRDAWQRINLEIDGAIVSVGSALAPVFIVALENSKALLSVWVSIDDTMTSLAEWAGFLGAQWANLQQIVSGIALQWYAIANLTNPLNFKSGDIEQIKQEYKTLFDLIKQGQEMFGKGFSGDAGREFLKQVEDKKNAIANSVIKSAEEIKSVARIIDASRPAALVKGSAAAASAIYQAQGDPRYKIAVDQLKVEREQAATLKRIERKGLVLVTGAM